MSFSDDFIDDFNNPDKIEEKRIRERKNKITRKNMEILEKCIKKNSIEDLDRTKPHDKTFVCGGFLSERYIDPVPPREVLFGNYRELEYFLKNDNDKDIKQMNEFVTHAKSELKKINIDYVDITDKDVKVQKSFFRGIFYTINSNIIPKNTFTKFSTYLIFRISNTTTNNTNETIEFSSDTFFFSKY